MSIKIDFEIECDQCNISIENQNEVFCKRCFSGLEDCVRVLKKIHLTDVTGPGRCNE